MRRILVTLEAMVAVICIAAPVGAQGPGSGTGDSWHFQLAPYVWLAGLEGEMATLPGLPKAEVDASISDVLEHTDLAFMVQGEARYGRIGFLADVVYSEISADGSTPGPLFGDIDLDAETWLVTLGMFYRVVEQERARLDLIGGLRIWDVYTKLDIDPGLLAGRTVEDDKSWADPLVGARGSIGLLGPLFFSAAGDIGGFSTASELTWQVVGTLDFLPRDWLTIRVGYRHLDVDYDDGDFTWDVSMSGPILGATIRF